MTPPNFGVTLDISAFQGTVNVDQVSAQLHKEGIPWLYMRAIHENGGVPDPVFLQRARAFEANAIHVGAYVFGVGNTPGPVLADRVEALWPIKDGRCHILDFEDNSKWGLSMTIAQGEEFVVRAQNHAGGRWPGMYGHSRLMGVPHNATFEHCPYLIPTYGTSYVLPPTWAKVGAKVWQASDGSNRWPVPPGCPRSFPGVGNCDIDLLQVPWKVFASSMLGIVTDGGLVLTDEDAKQLGYGHVSDWRAQEMFAKAVGDVLAGRAKRDGQDPAYYTQYDATAKKLAGNGGTGGIADGAAVTIAGTITSTP